MFRRLPLLAVLLAACGSRPPPVETPGKPDPTADAIRRVITPLYEDEVLHGGMVLAVIDPARDGGVTYLRFGRTSKEVADPPGEDAIFEIGSVSKVLTALLLAEAAAAGVVAIDTPAAQLLPFGVRFPDGGGPRVTLEHLASHQAGLPPLPENLVPERLTDPYAGYGRRQLYAYLERAQLLFAPGAAYSYSNLGAGLLGHLLELKLGIPYEQAVRDRVLAPLGLDETWLAVPDAVAGRAVPGTTSGGQFAEPWRFDVLAGAGGWRSTARDLVKLIVTAANAAASAEVPLGDVLRRTMTPVAQASGGMQIGLGWHIAPDGVVWHNGMTGGHASFVGFDPQTRRGVVVLASTASPLITRIGIGAFDVLAGKPLELGLDLVKLAVDELEPLVGDYRLADGQQLSVERDGAKLMLVMGDEKVRIFPRSKTEFVLFELESSLDFVVEDDRVLGFVLHLAGGDVVAERL
jgi:serine-type D-Ala-D-Ala carboxypeptidase/endopeptidase